MSAQDVASRCVNMPQDAPIANKSPTFGNTVRFSSPQDMSAMAGL
jgi:hypothetical protein